LITQAFNKVDGIKNTFKTTNGVSARAKLFNIRKISHWICENIQVPKRFRNIFREISKQVVFTDTYCEILNKEIDFRHSSSYSFLIHLILKYKTDEPTIIVKHTIFIEEYLKFMLQFSQPKLYIPSLIDILMECPGIAKIQRIKDGDNFVKGISIILSDVIDWIDNTLEIPEKYVIELGI